MGCFRVYEKEATNTKEIILLRAFSISGEERFEVTFSIDICRWGIKSYGKKFREKALRMLNNIKAIYFMLKLSIIHQPTFFLIGT